MSASTLWGEGNGTPLQHSCLENSMDGGAWWATVHGVTNSQTRLSNFTFFSFFLLHCRQTLYHLSHKGSQTKVSQKETNSIQYHLSVESKI